MATKPLKNHPGMWLRADAADAINDLEDKYGVIRINRAGATEADQQKIIDAWDRGDRDGLFPPARPAKASNHVKDGGIAVDVYNYNDDRAKLNEFGFQWYGKSDPVHYTFIGRPGGSQSGPIGWVTVNRSVEDIQRTVGAKVDGVYGPDTTAKVKVAQAAKGLTADGIWGPKTDAAYFPASGRPSSKAHWELSYADIQAALNRHGYNLKVDNVWGPLSSNALADFQRKNGLKVDRIVGAATWDKLNR
ncbi:endolysin [Microbacterium phage MonChoix]|uniref:Lysin A n=1 Tax=Microbacterium phage MonChoix TaxID=2590880 RepID=A0A4Y6EBD7_9CAUD|nr:endolysin [Microbacterium phage MonChoix]QDF15988.1 lysin A [Microbacterium phage MonChoix]